MGSILLRRPREVRPPWPPDCWARPELLYVDRTSYSIDRSSYLVKAVREDHGQGHPHPPARDDRPTAAAPRLSRHVAERHPGGERGAARLALFPLSLRQGSAGDRGHARRRG